MFRAGLSCVLAIPAVAGSVSAVCGNRVRWARCQLLDDRIADKDVTLPNIRNLQVRKKYCHRNRLPWFPTRNPQTTYSCAFGRGTELTVDSHDTKPVADNYPTGLDVPDYRRPPTCQVEGALDDEPKLLIIRHPIRHPTIMYRREPFAGLPLRVSGTERSAADEYVAWTATDPIHQRIHR